MKSVPDESMKTEAGDPGNSSDELAQGGEKQMQCTPIDDTQTAEITTEGKASSGCSSKLCHLTAHYFQKLRTRREVKNVFWAYQTMGVVFGALGTSPLYVYPSMNVEHLVEDDYLGILSIIFWTLTLIGAVKYGLIVLHADDDGEGGNFALYSLLCRYTNAANSMPLEKQLLPMSKPLRLKKANHSMVQNQLQDFIKARAALQNAIFAATMLGTCMLVGDGVITPAISVLSAVAGLKTAAPKISQNVVVIVSVALLIALFMLQRFGTEKVSFLFSPIMLAWLVTTPLIGVYNIVAYYPKIFKAFSPYYTMNFFSQHGKNGWVMLGGTILCITGAEAMFADLGHFNKRSIQMAFIFGVYPSNIITYTGQTAYLITHTGDQGHGSAFYRFIPNLVFWPMFVISTFAAVVASQGLISACFSLVKQAVALDLFPRVTLIHTSRTREGQIYCPEVNYFLMIFCIGVVLGYRDTSALGNAFGVTVVLVMFITTVLLTLVMLVVWGTPVPVALAFLCFFATIEGSYVSAVLVKVPQGGWFSFVVALLLALILFSWAHGRQKKRDLDKQNNLENVDSLDAWISHANVKRVPGLCFFYTQNTTNMGERGVPPVVRHYAQTVGSLHRVMVVMEARKAGVAMVSKRDKYEFKGGERGVYECIVNYGYMEGREEWESFKESVVQGLIEYVTARKKLVDEGINAMEGKKEEEEEVMVEDEHGIKEEEIGDIERAQKEGGVVVVGRVELVAKKSFSSPSHKGELVGNTRPPCCNWQSLCQVGFLFSRLRFRVYKLLQSNQSPTLPFVQVPPTHLVQFGMLYEV